MTAAARLPPVARANPVEVFALRCRARARLWSTGEIDLQVAVDELEEAAAASGLAAAIGKDEVQRLMAEAFGKAREAAPPTDIPEDEYEGLSSTFAALCRAADGKARRKPIDPRLARLRGLMADEVTLERAYAEVSKTCGVAESTLQAAEFLMQQKDAARLRSWLDRHSTSERQAILRHLEQRTGTRAQ